MLSYMITTHNALYNSNHKNVHHNNSMNGSANHTNDYDIIEVSSDNNNNTTDTTTLNDTMITTLNTTTDNNGLIDTKQQFILNLLRTKFHYNELYQRPDIQSSEAKELRNSLELISGALYSSDIHFVMELIQNADDNTYATSSDTNDISIADSSKQKVTPTIRFELLPHALYIYNNEVGFQENNIMAICTVGESTKKGQKGYIGQKGIGYVLSCFQFLQMFTISFVVLIL